MNVRLSLAALAACGAALASGCAGGPQPGAVAPADIPALESERQRHPSDVGLIVKLGIAYYDAKDYQKAQDVLASALALDQRNYPATVYQGLSLEELGRLDGARKAYNAAAALATTADQKREISNRLALLTRKELQQAAQQAIAQETQLSQQPPVENSVAVFPFRYVGTDEELRPLARGVTHLVITDLSRVSRLQLLERERVQTLVEELKLTDEGRVDPATGARSGRLLRAARVVQGSLQDLTQTKQLKLDADVVNATSAAVVGTGSGADKLQQFFDVEKKVVLQLLDGMGIALSPAEQRAISERPTADLQAFLAFSRGLEAEDRGDFRAAKDYFNAAVQRDPNFRAAADRGALNDQLSSALQVPPPQLAGLTGPNALSPSGASLGGGRAQTLQIMTINTIPSTGSTLGVQTGGSVSTGTETSPPATRPTLPETIGSTNPGSPALTGNVIIIITRP
jgi:TolB-like protein